MQKSNKNKRRKRRQFWYVIILLLLIPISYSLFNFWQSYHEEENSFVHYDGFGIDVPVGYSIHGIDVSRHQGYISWKSVKAMQVKDIKLDFVFIKATEGVTKVDVHFKNNWRKCGDMHIPRGAYHYYLANKSGAVQAENFMNVVKLLPGDMPPVVDVEQLYGTDPAVMRIELKLWLQIVEMHYGVKPIIYSYVNFYEKYLGKDFDNYPLWIAHYLQKKQPRIQRNWLFWQFSESGKVNGILSNADFNVFSGDSASFEEMLIKKN